MALFNVTIQELDDDGNKIEGHFSQTILSAEQITGKDGDTLSPSIMEWLLGLTRSGELNPKPKDTNDQTG